VQMQRGEIQRGQRGRGRRCQAGGVVRHPPTIGPAGTQRDASPRVGDEQRSDPGWGGAAEANLALIPDGFLGRKPQRERM
jgi:hypothetical protein